jgi:hypothetical protein
VGSPPPVISSKPAMPVGTFDGVGSAERLLERAAVRRLGGIYDWHSTHEEFDAENNVIARLRGWRIIA